MKELTESEVFGLLKTEVDAHTLGITTCASILKDCGYKVVLFDKNISEAIQNLALECNRKLLISWILDNKITCLGFSYRLDPSDGFKYFSSIMEVVCSNPDLSGQVKQVEFAGLPPTCEMVKSKFSEVICFPGGEPPIVTLRTLGVPEKLIPNALIPTSDYDEKMAEFGKNVISAKKYLNIQRQDHYGYATCGTDKDSAADRIAYCKSKETLPIFRAHAGPYNPDRQKALDEFKAWIADLRKKGLLDVLSLGTSQLTQSNFGEDWGEKPNGGGIPINSEGEFIEIRDMAKPILVRTYAGTKNIEQLAEVYERTLNISWHALSIWWFCEVDGRGPYSLLDNIRHQFETMKYIASTGKPLEPIVPHHFAFRGADDPTYVIAGVLAARLAKKLGIQRLVLQTMLNNPKHTWGVQDIAKTRCLYQIVKELESDGFNVYLQTRVGLDYYSNDLDVAKQQLASITAEMDDIDPYNENSPEIIHVVSYSEAVKLATPDIINESIQIALQSLTDYRIHKKENPKEFEAYNSDIESRKVALMDEVREALDYLETEFDDLYTPERFYYLFDNGYFPLPYMMHIGKHQHVFDWKTSFRNGGIWVIGENEKVIRTVERYKEIAKRKQ